MSDSHNTSTIGSPNKNASKSKVLGDYHLTKINKAFEDFWIIKCLY